MNVVWAIGIVLVNAVCCGLTVVGLPGNWMILAATAVYSYWMPDEMRQDVGWVPIGVLFVLALLGEAVELAASAAGVSKAGGSRRGAVLALAGSIAGAVIGLFIGVPIPLVGPIVGPLLFGGLGAYAGAVVGERWKGREFEDSLKVGEAAFVARILGTVGKLIAGVLMVAVVAGSVFV